MSHPDATAFLRRILSAPHDAVARQVFADWLDETGRPADQAWARYIRLRAEAAATDSGITRELLRDRAAAVAPQVVAELTLPAARFVPDFPAYLDLLPAPNYTLTLAGFRPPPTLARSLGGVLHAGALPLGSAEGRVLVGLADPRDPEATGPVERLVGVAVPVRIPAEELTPTVEAVLYPVTLTCQPTADPQPPAEPDPGPPDWIAEETRLYLEKLIVEARGRSAGMIELTADPSHYQVRLVAGGRTSRWHEFDPQTGRELVRAARALAARRLRVVVRPRNTYFGPGVRIVLLDPTKD